MPFLAYILSRIVVIIYLHGVILQSVKDDEG